MDQIIQVIKEFFEQNNISPGLGIAYIVVSILLAIMVVVALVMRLIVVIRYFSANRKKVSSGRSCIDVAREALDKAGLQQVQIKKASFLRAWFIGNCYSITKDTIFLRRTIYGKSTLTATGLALQKVGVAKLVHDGDKKTILRNRMQILDLLGPFLFVPIIIGGALIDFFVFQEFGFVSILSIVVSALLLVAAFIVTLLNIPVEKKANDMALEMIKDNGICTEDEQKTIKKVLDTYIVAYILEFIVTVLRIIQLILEILINAQAGRSSGN